MTWRAGWWKIPLSTGNPSLYLLIGKDGFLKKEFLDDLRRRLFPDGMEAGLNAQEFHAGEDPLSAVFDFLGTAPFAADKRLGVLWGIDGLEKEDQTRLLAGLGRLPGTGALVLETEETNARKNLFLRELSEKARLTPCHTPFERDLPAWVEVRAKKRGLTLDRRTVAFLVSAAGGELASLVSGIEQLAAFAHPRTHATLEDAEGLFQKRAEDDVFRLAEFLIDAKPAEALRVLDLLFQEGTRAPEVVAALGGQMERWRRGAARLAEGRTPEEIGLELKVPPFFQAAFFSRLKRTPRPRLEVLAAGLLTCDEAFKSGLLPERLALERFIWSS